MADGHVLFPTFYTIQTVPLSVILRRLPTHLPFRVSRNISHLRHCLLSKTDERCILRGVLVPFSAQWKPLKLKIYWRAPFRAQPTLTCENRQWAFISRVLIPNTAAPFLLLRGNHRHRNKANAIRIEDIAYERNNCFILASSTSSSNLPFIFLFFLFFSYYWIEIRRFQFKRINDNQKHSRPLPLSFSLFDESRFQNLEKDRKIHPRTINANQRGAWHETYPELINPVSLPSPRSCITIRRSVANFNAARPKPRSVSLFCHGMSCRVWETGPPARSSGPERWLATVVAREGREGQGRPRPGESKSAVSDYIVSPRFGRLGTDALGREHTC